jgi:hypothetical protein
MRALKFTLIFFGCSITAAFSQISDAKVIRPVAQEGISLGEAIRKVVRPLSDAQESSNISAHPNPANFEVNVKLDKEGATLIELYDAYGVVVYSFIPNGNSTTINTSAMPDGRYTLLVSYKSTFEIRRIQILH